MKGYSCKQKLGVILFDWPAFEYKLRSLSNSAYSHPAWVNICNRNESLTKTPNGWGVSCSWKWSSALHAAKVFPSLGARLMKKSLADWPIEFKTSPSKIHDNVELSFIIGHRGKERCKHLLTTLQTIAAQRNVAWECLVVEQALKPEIQNDLPLWTKYIHTPLPYHDMPYSRALAFDVGARYAKSNLLVFHDNDLLIPVDYAHQLLKLWRKDYEVINLKRFVFYMNRADSAQLAETSSWNMAIIPETILQNALGGSLAIDKNAYFAIGGFDTSFIGWGCEDNEFWERAQTRSVWPYAYLPVIHLWHQNQPGKSDAKETMAMKRYRQLSKISPEIRIERLLKDCSNKKHGNS